MTIEYLPLTRLVKSYRDGFAIDKLEEHFHCTIDSGHIRLKKFDHTYSIQIRGYCCGQFFPRWQIYEYADKLPLAIGLFLDTVQEQIISVTNTRCI